MRRPRRNQLDTTTPSQATPGHATPAHQNLRFRRWWLRLAPLAVGVAALVLTQTVHLSGVHHSGDGPTPSLTIPQKLGVPAYIDPTSNPEAWIRLSSSASSQIGLIVANVDNGPGDSHLDGWATAISSVTARGPRILGYVDTGYLGTTGQFNQQGTTDVETWIGQVARDTDAWFQFYGSNISGIFFDRAQYRCGTTVASDAWVQIYRQLTARVKSAHPTAITVLNPGTAVPECFRGSADVIVTFEGNYSSYVADSLAPNHYRPLAWEPADDCKIWHIVYDVADEASTRRVTELSNARHATYIYVTDDGSPNPYDALPSPLIWSAELIAVASTSRP